MTRDFRGMALIALLGTIADDEARFRIATWALTGNDDYLTTKDAAAISTAVEEWNKATRN